MILFSSQVKNKLAVMGRHEGEGWVLGSPQPSRGGTRPEPSHHTDLQSEIEALKEQFWYFHNHLQTASDPKTKKSASKSSERPSLSHAA
jgi:hypothetical protein